MYWWIRVFDYKYERDGSEKGTLLDEFYYKDIDSLEEVKQKVREKYFGNTAAGLKFAKPRKKDGVYAIVMESDQFFYDRFYKEIDTYCFMCHKPIKGKAKFFPKCNLEDREVYFCCYDCKREFGWVTNPLAEGEYQVKEEGGNGDIFGYVYLIYNRLEDIYYVGQTRYMPFFRWQEHVKAGGKGDLDNLVFSVLAEVRYNKKAGLDENQQYLNSIEAWWINKFNEEGYKTFNATKPRITIADLKEKFDDMVARQKQLSLI